MVAPTCIPRARNRISPRLFRYLHPPHTFASPRLFRAGEGQRVLAATSAPKLQLISSSRGYTQTMSTHSRASGVSFHEAALAEDVDEFERLAKAGIDVNAADAVGRLPLHTFCGAPWMHDESLLDDQVPRPATQWLLQHTKDIDTPDQDGITPLHIASMMHQYLVRQLLIAGADPTRTTCDGLNALHLAARARQSNIVGMLADATTNDDRLRHYISARDGIGRTPLHYACRSGRPESVSYLIAAGANPSSSDIDGRTPLDACLEFEEEQALWADYREFEPPDWYWISHTNLPSNWGDHALGGVRRQDEYRPWIRPSRVLQRAMHTLPGGPWPEDPLIIRSVQHTARLGEILDAITEALIDRGERKQTVKEHIAKCIKHCETTGLDYTRSCLFSLQSNFDPRSEESSKTDRDVLDCIQRSQSDLQERSGTRNDQPSDRVHLALINLLLRRRKYAVLERILQDNGSYPLLYETDVGDIARLLAKHGFVKLLRTLLKSRHGDRIVSETNHTSTSADPLLIVAVKRQLPNMDVVRLLVEEAHVDINCISRTGDEAYSDVDAPGVCYDFDVRQPGLNTALHECAKGFNWWQVKYCLPYLLSQGANPRLKNEAGATPYEVTQADYQETFMDEAAKVLKLTANDEALR